MFTVADSVTTIVQWSAFLAILGAIAGIGVLVARLTGIGERGRRLTALVLAGSAFVFLNPLFDRYVSGKYLAYLCRAEAGTFITRVVDNVEGFYLVRLRDPRDLTYRMERGDLPEEPYGHSDWEARNPGTFFINPPWRNYRFVETPLGAGPTAEGIAPPYLRLSGYRSAQQEPSFVEQYGYAQSERAMHIEAASVLRSRYAYSWEETSTRALRYFGIHRGALRIVDLESGEVLATKVGFVRTHGGGACPDGARDRMLYEFVSSVLRPPPAALPE